MADVIFRGSTPTIRMSPTNGMSVADLGTPTLGISQELVFINPEVIVDTEENAIQTTLTEAETLQLVEGQNVDIQQSWVAQDGSVIRFPVHSIPVLESVVEQVTVEEGGGEEIDIPPDVPEEGEITTEGEEFEEEPEEEEPTGGDNGN